MKLIVGQHKIEIEKTPVNEKELNVTEIEFEFDEAITNNYVKEAYFTLNNNTYKKIIVNNKCGIPSEVLTKEGQVEIGVVAYLVENEEEIKRYNPSPVFIKTWEGSLKNAQNTEPITPSEMEQYEQALQDGLTEVNEKLDDIDQALEDVNTAITETNNLDLDVSKSGKVATVTLTKKDATTKFITLSDGTNLMFNWDGTKLGIKTDEDENYQYVDLQGVQGETGPMGAPFTIKKTYSSVAEMNADFNNMEVGDYVMITSTVELEDNAKLYSRGETQWIFITDFSGATGIQGPTGATPNIQIGTVQTGDHSAVTRTGTNENPVLNFVLEKGDKGDQGVQGETGNGIASITKTGTVDTVDTYTITYTNGTTTTFTVTNGEVSQAQLDALEDKVEYYKKYSNALISNNNTGTILSINDTAECPMKIGLNGNTSQTTYTGVNLFDGELENGSYDNTGTKTSSSVNYRNKNFIPVLPNTQYTFSIDGTSQKYCTYYYDENKTFLEMNVSLTTGTFTTPNECYYLNFRCFQTDYTSNFASLKVQLQTGSEATTYEPYVGGIPSPNPSYPQPIKKVTGNNTITVCGKNIFNINNPYSNSGASSSINNNQLTVTKTTTTSENCYTAYRIYNIINNTTYNFSYTAVADNIGAYAIRGYKKDGTYVNIKGSTQSLNVDTTITIPNDIYYLTIFFYASIAGNAGSLNDKTIYSNIQLEHNTIKTTYEPYQSQTYPINIGAIELCKIGNYQDTIFQNIPDNPLYNSTLTEGSWYVMKNIGKKVFDGTEGISPGSGSGNEGWRKSTTTDNDRFIYDIKSSNRIYGRSASNCKCNYFTYSTSNVVSSWRPNPTNYVITQLVFNYTQYNTTTLEQWLTWLTTHNLVTYMVLLTPTYTEITDSTLITQLNNISRALSYKTQTNITQVNNDLPFNLDVDTIYDLNVLLARVEALEEE